MKRIDWIDGVKAIACVGVFWYHFYEVFIQYSDFGKKWVSYGISNFFEIINVFINGGFWVCIFCILGGYLASKKKICSLKELISSLILRYMRFVIPFFIAGLFIWIINQICGFHTGEGAIYLENSWIGGFYRSDITIREIAKLAFRFAPLIDAPVWMIKPLFFSTCIIYIINYFASKWKYFNKNIMYMVLIGGGVWIKTRDGMECIYFICCFLGPILSSLWKILEKINNKLAFTCILGILFLLSGAHNRILIEISRYINLPAYIFFNMYWNMIYAFLILGFINSTKKLKAVLAGIILKRINSISISVFLMHWPVICSFSLLFYRYLKNYWNYTILFCLNLMCTSFVVIVISIIHFYCSNEAAKKITLIIKKQKTKQ